MTNGANPFFSVVIPVYNRAGLLRVTIDSVLAQTEQDFEIIVVDDGSADNPKAIVDEAADSRVRFERKDNGGGGAARNRGIDLARGRYIAFLDSDDRFLPHHLAAMRGLVEGKENIAAYACIIVDRGNGRTFLKPPRAIKSGEHMASYLFCDRGFVPSTTLVVAKAVAARVRYDESLPFAQDTDFAIRLFLAGCAFAMAEEPGAIWRDLHDPERTSAGRKGASLKAWLEKLKPVIPEKAYRGARGWLIAKGVAAGSKRQALALYVDALASGCYRPRLALVVFLQIFVPDRFYRLLADQAIAFFRGDVWSRAERECAAAGE